MLEATLIDARMLSPNVREVTFEVGSGFSFQPGQWVNVHFPGHGNNRGEPLKRSYSIASAHAGTGRFDLCVAHAKGGQAGALLHAARVGDRFSITGAFGQRLLAPIERPFLMVATGTGIAPFRSMLQASAVHVRQPMALLFGNRNESEILYRSEFETLERNHPLFSFFPTLSRPSAAWPGRIGHVQSHLLDIAKRMGGTDCDVYICGQSAMVTDVRHILHEQVGIDAGHIHGHSDGSWHRLA